MVRKRTLIAVVAATFLAAAILYECLPFGARRIESILAAYQEHSAYADIGIQHPLDGTLFPPEMAPPVFHWQDSVPASRRWLVRITWAEDEPGLHVLVRRPRWTPPPQDWKQLKLRSLEQEVHVTILGVGRGRQTRILSRARMSLRTSQDPVGAPLFYREVVLPFAEADRRPSGVRWRFGTIDRLPPVVWEQVPVCANCHSFSRDGTTLGMDADYAQNKGAYLIAPVREQMTLTPAEIISWNDFEKGEGTFGFLSQVSPDGQYVISTVKDLAVFVMRPTPAFSQLFYPVKGILAVYDRQSRTFRALPGADDPNLVQTNPTWSPDGREIVFARAPVPDLSNTGGMGLRPLTRADSEMLVLEGRPLRFDLYRIPFNGGAGGTPQPLEGASHNGMSNYFPRYSPDRRWIVFCRADRFMLLQPDSELYLIPAEGGAARRLRANTRRMNSWHSWSPNGKWLVFASKAWSDYTQLCLTHIDDNGDSSPPVLLSHLTTPDRAANLPEFVNTHPTAIRQIREHFVTRR